MIGPNDVQPGTPRERGRYLVFLRCASPQISDWAEPSICNWNGDKWETSFLPQNRIVGYVGPIAPMKVNQIYGVELDRQPPAQEFDL